MDSMMTTLSLTIPIPPPMERNLGGQEAAEGARRYRRSSCSYFMGTNGHELRPCHPWVQWIDLEGDETAGTDAGDTTNNVQNGFDNQDDVL